MIFPHEITIERVVAAPGEEIRDNSEIVSHEVIAATGIAVRRTTAKTLFELAQSSAIASVGNCAGDISAVVAATFSNEVRFPSLAVKVASELGLSTSVPAFDLQMACSAYPYALLTAAQLAGTTGGKVLVIDGDVQSRFAREPATAVVASDACTASVVSVRPGTSRFAFHSSYGEELKCADHLEMDGFGVFSFVAKSVRSMTGALLNEEGELPRWFVPHQANMYMVRQLAKSLRLGDRLLTSAEKFGNVGSASIALTLASAHLEGVELCGERVLLAGFGAGLSAAATFVRVSEDFSADII